MKEWAESFYKSKQWQYVREQYAKSKAYLCEDCAARGVVEPGVIVHHVVALNPENIKNRDIALNPKNLRLLCRSCHERIHRRPAEVQRRYVVDEMGRVRTIEE